MENARILIVEDEPLIAEDLSEIICENGFRVVGIAYDKLTALDKLAHHTIDLVLLDINLGSKMEGMEIAKTINEKYKLPFIYITSYADKNTLNQAKSTRPMAYIVKPFDEKDIFTAIEIALFNYADRQNKAVLSEQVINQYFSIEITPKEFEILLDIRVGKTNQEMAKKHFVSINTIKTHVQNIYQKLDVHTRSEAIFKTNQALKQN